MTAFSFGLCMAGLAFGAIAVWRNNLGLGLVAAALCITAFCMVCA